MKYFLTGVVLSVSIIISAATCKKETETGSYSKAVIGTWQWARTDGGIANHIHETPASTGKQIELKLTADNKYYFYTNGNIISEGTYSFRMEKSIHDHSEKPVIDFSADQDLMIHKIDQQNLELSDNAYDGVGIVYSRKTQNSN